MDTTLDIANRLKEIIDFYKLSTRAFAIQCGITQATLDRQVKGQRGVSVETLIAICNRFPEVSKDWLLVGEGEMFKSKTTDINTERVMKLVDTISTLQDTINSKDDTIAALNERIRQLENQLKSK
ncbi:MAG: helix-turn-helix domain-containing protein [Bacteroides sp.]|nr:helix-turn-helix domain-containing protein [Bacteroides sp.]